MASVMKFQSANPNELSGGVATASVEVRFAGGVYLISIFPNFLTKK
jgi:hypothetical protein